MTKERQPLFSSNYRFFPFLLTFNLSQLYPLRRIPCYSKSFSLYFDYHIAKVRRYDLHLISGLKLACAEQ